MHLIFII
jgi:hypothetical protein